MTKSQLNIAGEKIKELQKSAESMPGAYLAYHGMAVGLSVETVAGKGDKKDVEAVTVGAAWDGKLILAEQYDKASTQADVTEFLSNLEVVVPLMNVKKEQAKREQYDMIELAGHALDDEGLRCVSDEHYNEKLASACETIARSVAELERLGATEEEIDNEASWVEKAYNEAMSELLDLKVKDTQLVARIAALPEFYSGLCFKEGGRA